MRSKWRIILLALSLLLATSYAQVATPQSQIDTLKEFYTAMGGDYWYISTNWNEGDPCSVTEPWYGINCINVTAFQSSVNSIDLSFNNLTGELPEDFSQLSNLNYIYLNSNSITGTIPESLYTDIPLKKLILGSNKISGSISSNISSLTSTLSYLDLQMNKLSGEIPDSFYQLKQVTGILLNGNALKGTVSEYIKNFTSLQTLHLDTNELSGTLPNNLYSLSSISELFLGTNNFQGTISTSIGYLTKLQKLEISNTAISGEIPSRLYSLTQLQYLNLGLNRLTGTISSSISNFKQLSQLNLQSNQEPSNKSRFNGTIPNSLWSLTNLQYLYLSFNEFSGTIPSSVGNLAGLVVLDLGQNKLSGTIPESIFNLVQLETLFLQDNQFSGTLSDQFGQLTNLQNLLLNTNQLTGTIPNIPFFTDYSLSGDNILTGNPFLCPVPDFAKNPPLSAGCQWWDVTKVTPSYGSVNGGQMITITGSKFTQLTNGLQCSFSNDSQTLSSLQSTATYINTTAVKCTTPIAPYPTSNITNFGVSLFYNSQSTTGDDNPIPYIYQTTPTITSITPSNSRQQGGIEITVLGVNFANTDQFNALFCSFNSILTPAVFINTSLITCSTANLNLTGVFPFKVSNDNGAHFSNTPMTIQYYAWCATNAEGVACNGQGECNNATSPVTCDCNSTFTGSSCDACLPLFFGPSCLSCPDCIHGVCLDGINGTGSCDCDWQYTGSVCSVNWFFITCFFVAFVLVVFLIFLILFGAVFMVRKMRAEKRKQIEEMKIATENQPLVNAEEKANKEVDWISEIDNNNDNNNENNNNNNSNEISNNNNNNNYSMYQSIEIINPANQFNNYIPVDRFIGSNSANNYSAYDDYATDKDK